MRAIIAVALAGLTGLVWLLWPLPTDSRWSIEADPAALAVRSERLADLARAGGGLSGRINVLLILADDLARHDVSAYGATPMPTPGIDRLAALGTRFEQATAADPVCSPSRAALLTGRYPQRFGFESQPMQRYPRNLLEYLGFRWLIDTDAMTPILADSYPEARMIERQGLPATETTLADLLAAAGWRTGIFGKWHLGYADANGPDRFGFATVFGFDEAFTLYAPAGRTDIVEHRHELFWERHIWSMGRSGPSALMQDGRPVETTTYLTDEIADRAIAFMDSAIDADAPFFAYVPFSAPHTPFQARREDYDALADVSDHNQRVYLAMIRRLDHAVGRMLDALEQRGALERTLIVFTSDNGGADYTGATDNGPLRGGKFTQFEGGLAVPLVISGPGWSPGGVRNEPVSLLDLVPTLLAAVGLPIPGSLDGEDLNAPSAGERSLFWRTDFNRAIRAGDWKLVEDLRDGSLRLFDLGADAGEATDRAAAQPARVRALREQLDRWTAQLAPPAWPRVMNYRYCDPIECRDFAI